MDYKIAIPSYKRPQTIKNKTLKNIVALGMKGYILDILSEFINEILIIIINIYIKKIVFQSIPIQ